MIRNRALRLTLTAVLLILLSIPLLSLHAPTREYYLDPWTGNWFGEGGVDETTSDPLYKENQLLRGSANGPRPYLDVVKGKVIMPELGNATAKAELGRATWKLLHTMTLRYPENPTPDEREALKHYFYLTARLYPCGECASHFQKLLKEYPPQTSSRKTASLWLCHIHNLVNASLNKPEFDCAKLDETYDCGCGPEPSSSADLKRKEEGVVGSSSSSRGEPVKEDEITGVDMIKGGVRRRRRWLEDDW